MTKPRGDVGRVFFFGVVGFYASFAQVRRK